MQTSDADRLLGVTHAAGRQTRSILAANSFPLILFGVLALASAPVAEVWSWPAIAVLWLVGAPLASVATGLWYRSRELELGVAANASPFIATAACIVVGATALGIAGRGGPLSYAGPLFVIGLGYLVFARLERSAPVASLAACVLVSAIALALLRPPHAYTIGVLVFGGGSVLLGVVSLVRERRISG
jgi:hypothetical protein